MHDACAVDHDVDTAKGLRHILDGPLTAASSRPSTAKPIARPPCSGDPVRGRAGSVFVDVKGRDPGSFFGKPLADRPPDSARSAPVTMAT